MTTLFEIKELLVSFYRKFEKYIVPIGKFLFAFLVLIKLNHFFGFTPILNKGFVSFLLAGIAAFVPATWFALLLMFVTAGQLFTASIEAAALLFLVMLVGYIMFVRLQPELAYLAIIVPLLYSFKLVYLVPIFAGLFLSPASILPIAVGVGVHYFGTYMPNLLEIKSAQNSLYDMPETLMNMYKYLTNAVIHDKNMMLTILVFAVVILVMYFLRNFEIDYVFYITIAIGGVVNIIGFLLGSILFKSNISVVGVFIGSLVAMLLVVGCQFFRFTLVYQRAEKVQFEDDDFYYYVRAIPKVKIAKAVKEIKKIK